MNYELTKNETKCSFLKTTLIRSIWLPAHPPARPPAHLHTSPSACPSMCLPARPSACLPVYTRFYKQSERLHKCDVADCGKEYFHSWHLRRHKTNIHNKSSYKTYFKCSYPGCFMELSSEQNLKRHHYRAHKRKHPFVCEYCDKDFVKHNQLRTHIFQHTGVPPFRCEECTVGFTSARELKRHQRSHRNYKCDCGKNFRFWSLLQQHNKLFHPPEFTCDVCQKRFMSRCKLKVHVLIHQDPSNRDLLLCPYDNCERSYMYKRNLTEHMKRFHEKNLFECSHPDCGRKLSSKKKLEYHLKLHEAKRPPRRNTRPRNKRRDAGKPKRAASALLCGFTYEEEKALLAINSVTNDTTDIELCMLGVDQLSDKTTESPDTGITKNKESKKTNQEHSDMGMTEEFDDISKAIKRKRKLLQDSENLSPISDAVEENLKGNKAEVHLNIGRILSKDNENNSFTSEFNVNHLQESTEIIYVASEIQTHTENVILSHIATQDHVDGNELLMEVEKIPLSLDFEKISIEDNKLKTKEKIDLQNADVPVFFVIPSKHETKRKKYLVDIKGNKFQQNVEHKSALEDVSSPCVNRELQKTVKIVSVTNSTLQSCKEQKCENFGSMTEKCGKERGLKESDESTASADIGLQHFEEESVEISTSNTLRSCERNGNVGQSDNIVNLLRDSKENKCLKNEISCELLQTVGKTKSSSESQGSVNGEKSFLKCMQTVSVLPEITSNNSEENGKTVTESHGSQTTLFGNSPYECQRKEISAILQKISHGSEKKTHLQHCSSVHFALMNVRLLRLAIGNSLRTESKSDQGDEIENESGSNSFISILSTLKEGEKSSEDRCVANEQDKQQQDCICDMKLVGEISSRKWIHTMKTIMEELYPSLKNSNSEI
ncbi:uncharacterized protein [Periplaneta americana]|uniref:uncharacterized protein isoform X2 n=1 Tax=Periplaneta americana TaxID=6978 RepID=UPI0037E807C2